MHIAGRAPIRTAALVLVVMTMGSLVSAQEISFDGSIQPHSRLAEAANRDTVKIRDWPLIVPEPQELRPHSTATSGPQAQSSRFQPSGRARKYNTAQRILASVGMGAAGFFAGGYVGAQLEPPCACDDPGLKGFMIGAPIGAVAGAIFGAWLTR